MRHLLFLMAILAGVTPLFAQTEKPSHQSGVDPASITHSVSQLRRFLMEELRRSGTDPETRHIHLIIGFSTGHFSADPISLKAMHEIASGLVDTLLVQGDRVSVYAWEMGVWKHPGSEHNPWVVPSDRKEDKASVRKLFPMTCRTGSKGGHDTERAIVEITAIVQVPTDEVIVLLTNSASSIASPSERPIGEDAPQYLKALQQWRRVNPGTNGNASLQLKYVALKPDGEQRMRSVDAVVLLPKRFRAGILEHGTRSERTQVATASPPPSKAVPALQRDWFVAAVILIFALMVVLTGYRLAVVQRGNRRLIDITDTLTKQVAEVKEQLLRHNATTQAAAEMQNLLDDLREQRLVAIKEKERWQRAVVQSFEAIEAVVERPEIEAATKKTYERVYNVLSRVFAPLGFQVIRPARGDLFDERVHVVDSTVEDETLPNMSVVQCVQWGYSIGSELVRPAKVVIALHPDHPSRENEPVKTEQEEA